MKPGEIKHSVEDLTNKVCEMCVLRRASLSLSHLYVLATVGAVSTGRPAGSADSRPIENLII